MSFLGSAGSVIVAVVSLRRVILRSVTPCPSETISISKHHNWNVGKADDYCKKNEKVGLQECFQFSLPQIILAYAYEKAGLTTKELLSSPWGSNLWIIHWSNNHSLGINRNLWLES